MRRSLRYTGVAAVVAVWTSLLAATALTDFNLLGKEPLSFLGTQSRSAVLFTLGLAVPAVLLTAFHQHLRGRFPVSPGFSLAMLAGLAGQMVAAFVPIGRDPAVSRVHTTSALVLGASLPLLMWRFAAGQPRGPWRRLSYGLFWVEIAACVPGVYLSALMVAPLAEILPGAVFHAWIIAVTFGASGVRARVEGHRSPARPRREDHLTVTSCRAQRCPAQVDELAGHPPVDGRHLEGVAVTPTGPTSAQVGPAVTP